MYSQPNPTTENLLNWIEGRASTEESASIEARLAGDEALQQDVRWLRAFTGLREHLVLASPPSHIRRVLEERFAAYAERKAASAHAQGNAQPGLWQRLVAALTFDSATQLGMAGVRSAQIASARQLIYASDLAEIALNVAKPNASGNFNILGQILPMPTVLPEGFVIQLLKSAEEVALCASDELGEFSFEEIQPGDYSLMLTYEQTSILLTPITLMG